MLPRRHLRFDPEEIGRRVRAARLAHDNMTSEKLGDLIGMAANTLAHKEVGTSPFFLGELSRIADALDAPPLWPFLDWEAAQLLARVMRDLDAPRRTDE